MTIGDDGVAGAYVRRPNGSYLQIQPPPGGSYPSVAGINASGQVAFGWAHTEGSREALGVERKPARAMSVRRRSKPTSAPTVALAMRDSRW